MTTNTPEILMATTTNDVAPGPNDNHLSDHLPEPPPHPHMWISTIEELEYYCEIGPTVIKRHIPRRGVIAPKARYGIDGRLFPLEEMHERNAKFDELKKVEAMENREKERRGKKRNWFIIKQVVCVLLIWVAWLVWLFTMPSNSGRRKDASMRQDGQERGSEANTTMMH